MKIRITNKGYESLNGYFGTVLFENGVSVNDVPPMDINQIAAVLSVVDAETDKPVGQAQVTFEHWAQGQESTRLLNRAEQRALQAKQAAEGNSAEGSKAAKAPVVVTAEGGQPKVYTREELEAIADTKGITGLRDIGDALNAKARGIPSLITAILNAQARVNFTPQVAE